LPSKTAIREQISPANPKYPLNGDWLQFAFIVKQGRQDQDANNNALQFESKQQEAKILKRLWRLSPVLASFACFYY